MRNLLFLFSIAIFSSLEAMSLDETIAYALEHNNALRQAEVSMQHTKSLRDNKEAQKYGRLDVLASYDYYNNARTLTPLTPMSIVGSPDGAYTIPTTQNMFSVGVAYNVVLFDGFAQQNSYKISDLHYRVSSLKSSLGREELIYNVKNLYISLLAAQEQLEAQNLYTISQKRIAQQIAKELELGSKSKLDFLRAQSSVTASESQVASIVSNIAILKATLSALMGDKTFDKTQAIDINMQDSVSFENSEDSIESLKRYQAAELNVVASERKKDQAKSAYYPHIDFSAYYGQNFGPNSTKNSVPFTSIAPTAGETLIDEGEWNNEANYQIGIHLKWNILDFGQTSSLTQAAKLSYLQAKLESQSVAIELQKNIESAQNKITLAQAQYSNAQAQYHLLCETQKMEKVRYENDALSLTDLLNTSAKKELAYVAMINAKYNYKKANYYLDYLFEKGDVK
jgi:outer membrane protein TolC